MARPYSEDLRERIVQAVEGGASRNRAAAQFAVSISCVVKLLQRWDRTGSVSPGRMGGWKRHTLEAHHKVLEAILAARPDLTLDELSEALAEKGIAVGRSSVRRYLIACGLTLKKSRSTPLSRNGPMSPKQERRGARRRPS